MKLTAFIDKMFGEKPPKPVDYTHWDIIALARIIAPDAWQALDEAFFNNPKTGKPYHYMDNLKPDGIRSIGTYDSFLVAVDLLKSGVSLKGNVHLWSDGDVVEYLEKVNNHGTLHS